MKRDVCVSLYLDGGVCAGGCLYVQSGNSFDVNIRGVPKHFFAFGVPENCDLRNMFLGWIAGTQGVRL